MLLTKKIKYFLYLLLLLCFEEFYAQHPSHYFFGQEELSGLTIFDIEQDQKNNYWFATNQGLFKFNGHAISRVASSQMISNAVFDLKHDNYKILYCKNLSGQIFKISDDTCQLFFQLPDSLVRPNFDYNFNQKNQLIISSKSIFKVINNKELFFFKSPYFKSPYFRSIYSHILKCIFL